MATGVVGAAGGLGGFLLPSLLGILKDLSGSYGTGFFLFSLAAFYCAIVLAYVQHDWRREWASTGVGVSS